MDKVLVVLFCLMLNALLAAFEMAFVSVSRGELRRHAKHGNKHAQTLLLLRENPERTLSIIQVGITLVGAIAAAVGGAGAGETLEPYFVETYQIKERVAEVLSVIVVVLPITFLNVVIGELVPKTLALRHPLQIVFGGAKALFVADRVFSPVISILEWSTKKFLNLFFPKAKTGTSAHPHAAIDLETLSPAHQTLMMNMAGIEKKKMKDVLLPWTKVTWIQKSDSLEDVTKIVVTSGHTRIPVLDDGFIVGILHTKEFIAFKESGETDWYMIIRPALVVLSEDSALGVLRMLQSKRTHMAIVTTPSRECVGLVTLEDILESIVGNIFDEDDDGRIRKVYAAKLRGRPLSEDL